ncbi:inositol-tetrakisphosphate 1-kinase 1 [Rosa sericea]
MSNSNGQPPRRHRIGYAFPPKKEQTFIQPSLITHAGQHGIDLVPVDASKALTQQGPFDCIIHKLYDDDWNQQLKEYSSLYPRTVILDPPESIARLHNRVSMLDVINAAFKAPRVENVGVPKQVLIHDPAELESDLGLKFPVIAKPVLANGSAKSHQMSMVFSGEGLKKVETPILLQEFVNHGGTIFKVYVIGDYTECVKRRSLPDISDEQRTKLAGVVVPFSQISNEEVNIEGVEMPPPGFVEELAKGICDGLKLNFFNFDVIRDSNDKHSYYVIDINYFPGYAKLHNFEHLLTDFFLAVLSNKSKSQSQLEQE